MTNIYDRSAYDYELPDELIATKPANPRQESRLMFVQNGAIRHKKFSDLAQILRANDLVVINNVAVQRARFFAVRATGGRVEVLLTQDAATAHRRLTCLWKARARLRVDEILFAEKDQGVRLRLSREKEAAYVEFLGEEPVVDILTRIGELALPPYIVKRRQSLGEVLYNAQDEEDYQTVYASDGAAIAAPTAGLHFSVSQIRELQEAGIKFSPLRLDVGPGTFQPIRSDDLNEHRMHSESYEIPEELVRDFAACKNAGGRVIAVGTTVVRSLEDQAQRYGELRAGVYDTDIFIKPGHRFTMLDAMITNFHLPASTLMVLISAFAGYELVREAYAKAIAERYRFYSYGDAMLLFKGA
ncbi:MAG: tRNA preQ1(34) S-adenosylmethionine ribosyltransferase-isomerase QueA [Bradymonadales bacterium]|jgi:S-adenosylmethionine:tRNA ribosyltransferase-isomerase